MLISALSSLTLTLSLAGVGAAAAAGGGPGTAPALERPAVRHERSLERFEHARRARRRLALSAPYVLGVPRATLEAIASCESGGDPRATSADGSYRGKYQFSYSTWASVGGSGDPARAGELEQDRRAAMLYALSGSSPWPVCG